MAEVHHLAYGWVNPVLAYVMSVLGCLLGILLTTKARARSGRRRVRLLAYAAVSIGGTGIWLMHFVAILGFDVPASALRYDPLLTAASLGIAVVVVGAGLFLVGYGPLGFLRLVAAGTLVGVGISAMHYTGMTAVHLGGTVDYEPRRFVASVVIAMAVASAALWFATALKGPGAAVIAALVMGAGISGMHYTGMSAVRVRLDLNHPDITGVGAIFLIAPIVLLGAAVIAMVAFFTFGNSTMEDVRAIYDAVPRESTGVIEKRVLADVLSRVTAEEATLPVLQPVRRGVFTVARPIVGDGASRRTPRPRPTPGIQPIWLSMPVWGATEADGDVIAAARVNGRPGGTGDSGVSGGPGRFGGSNGGSRAGNEAVAIVPSRYPPRSNLGPTDAPAKEGHKGSARNSGWRNRSV